VAHPLRVCAALIALAMWAAPVVAEDIEDADDIDCTSPYGILAHAFCPVSDVEQADKALNEVYRRRVMEF